MGAAGGEDPLETARHLLAKIKQAKLFDAFNAWKALSEFEATAEAAQETLHRYADTLNTPPPLRTSKNIHALCGLLQKVNAYKKLPRPVLEFLATYCRLLVVWDSVELPRGSEDAASLFSIVTGRMSCIVADATDPVLRCMVKDAADQLMLVESEQKAAVTPEPNPFVVAQKAAGNKPGPDPSPEAVKKKQIRRADSMAMLGLPMKYAVPTVQSRLWHTVAAMIHAGRMPSRKEAEARVLQELISQAYEGPRGSQFGGAKDRASMAGGPGGNRVTMAGVHRVSIANAEGGGGASGGGGGAGKTRVSELGGKPRLSEFGRQSSNGGVSRRASVAGGALGGGGHTAGVTLLDLGPGDSFSGRDLDCRGESGLAEQSSAQEFPPRTLASMTAHNCVTALVVVGKPVYKRAVQMAGEAMVQQAVADCCRLPFLRHSPLKELFRLSRHLTHATYHKGDVLLQQGKDCNNLYMLIEGEVDIVMDAPLVTPPSDQALLASSQQGNNNNVMLGAAAAAAAAAAGQGVATFKQQQQVLKGAQKGPLQRVLLARRGAGSILGDDALRDKKMMVSVVVRSTTATALWTSQNRFTMCVDALTLRLFHKVRAQQGQALQMMQAIADEALRNMLLERCRGALLQQTFTTPELPSTLQRPTAATMLAGPINRWMPAVAGAGFFSVPTSIETGIREAAVMEQGGYDFDVSQREDELRGKQRNSVGAAGKLQQGGGCPLCEAEAEEKFGPMPALSKGISSAWLKNLTCTDSIMRLKQIVTKLEAERAVPRGPRGPPRACPHRVFNKLDAQAFEDVDPSAAALGVERSLDLRDQLVQVASNRLTTDMMEAACVAVIRVECVPGQMPHGVDELAPVLDDANVAWSTLAHNSRLLLVRWSSHEYLLLAPIEPSGNRRPVVRLAADVLLGMMRTFESTIATNQVPHLVLHVGLAVGTTFVSMDTGRFITGISGVAFEAAQRLCAGAEDCFPSGGVLVSDAVMQAISRTHVLGFAGQGYHLQGEATLPFSTTFEQLLGQDAVVSDPAANSSCKAKYETQLHKLTTSHDQAPRAAAPGPGGLEGDVSVHFVASGELVNLGAGAVAPAAVKGGGIEQGPQGSGQPAGYDANGREGLATDDGSRRRSGQAVQSSYKSNYRQHRSKAGVRRPGDDPQHMEALGGSLPEGGLSAAQAAALGTAALGTRVSDMRNALGFKSKMQIRQQLKAELRELGCNHLPAGDLSRIPHSTFTPGARDVPGLPALRPAGQAGVATQHLNLTTPSPTLAPRPGSPPRFGFMSRTSAEASAGIPPGQASGMVSPHAVLVHSMTPFGPGSGPLADLPARQRAADVLFAGAAINLHTASSIPQVRPPSTGERQSGGTPPPPPSDPLGTAARGGTLVAREAVAAAVEATAVPPATMSGRALAAPQPAAVAAAVASVAAGTRTMSPSGRAGLASPMSLASPSLRPCSPCRQPSPLNSNRAGTPERRPTSPATHIPSNHGMVPLEHLLQQQGQQMPVQLPAPPMAPVGAMARHKDPVTGLTRAAIHKQAVSTWKDMGSVRAADTYVQQLPQGLLNISFSTAGLPHLPQLDRLAHLESLAGAFNLMTTLSSGWLASLSPHLRVLSLSHSLLKELPTDFGSHLQNVTELNLSCNQLTTLPESVGAMPKLRCLSLEHNQLSSLPSSLWCLDCLEQLYLGNNALEALPDCLGAFTALQLLHVEGNHLEELPSSLTELGSIMSLDVSHNKISRLPAGTLASLTSLRHLALQHNKLCSSEALLGLQAERSSHTYRDDGAFDEPISRSQSQRFPHAAQEALSRMSSLAVTPSAMSFKLRQSTGNPDDIRNAAGVRNVLEGKLSMRKSLGGQQSAGRSRSTGPAVAAGDRKPSGKGLRASFDSGMVPSGQTSQRDNPSRKSASRPGSASSGAPVPIIRSKTSPGAITTDEDGEGAAHATSHAENLRHVGFQMAASGELPAPDSTGGQPIDKSQNPTDKGQETGDSAVTPAAAHPAAVQDSSAPGAVAAPSPRGRSTDGTNTTSSTPTIFLPRLTQLNLSGNQLISVPDWLPPSLVLLNLSKNSISELPGWFCCRLPLLEQLALHSNQLRAVPLDVTELEALVMLSLENNPVTDPEAGGGTEGVAWAFEGIKGRINENRIRVLSGGTQALSSTMSVSTARTRINSAGPSLPSAGVSAVSRPGTTVSPATREGSTSTGPSLATSGTLVSRPATVVAAAGREGGSSGAVGGMVSRPVTQGAVMMALPGQASAGPPPVSAQASLAAGMA